MKWLPQPGELFYVTCNVVRERPVENMMGDVIAVTKTRDGSYRTDVFRAVASDDTMLVGEHVRGGYIINEPVIFRRSEWDIAPVGPDVATALNLQSENKE